MDINLSATDIILAAHYAGTIEDAKNINSVKNNGKYKMNGFAAHYIGMLGEVAICKYLNINVQSNITFGGDGGVDLSPIADLTKTQVFKVAKAVEVIDDILIAKPTDGLWPDGRSDEDQIGATYPELEWAMDFEGDENELSDRQKEVLKIYRSYHQANKHKMEPIPVCELPLVLKENLLTL